LPDPLFRTCLLGPLHSPSPSLTTVSENIPLPIKSLPLFTRHGQLFSSTPYSRSIKVFLLFSLQPLTKFLFPLYFFSPPFSFCSKNQLFRLLDPAQLCVLQPPKRRFVSLIPHRFDSFLMFRPLHPRPRVSRLDFTSPSSGFLPVSILFP